ncbi:MAG: hypothetical protein Ct9H300mP12_10220 [Acidimicrobiales bacterium]|nr:MAG: hypothetical protein Ct9H300mP12_10220 [Acidimicrobiales bacterium]
MWDGNWKFLTENSWRATTCLSPPGVTLGAWMPMDSVVFPDERHGAFTYQMFEKDENAIYGRPIRTTTV